LYSYTVLNNNQWIINIRILKTYKISQLNYFAMLFRTTAGLQLEQLYFLFVVADRNLLESWVVCYGAWNGFSGKLADFLHCAANAQYLHFPFKSNKNANLVSIWSWSDSIWCPIFCLMLENVVDFVELPAEQRIFNQITCCRNIIVDECYLIIRHLLSLSVLHGFVQ